MANNFITSIIKDLTPNWFESFPVITHNGTAPEEIQQIYRYRLLPNQRNCFIVQPTMVWTDSLWISVGKTELGRKLQPIPGWGISGYNPKGGNFLHAVDLIDSSTAVVRGLKLELGRISDPSTKGALQLVEGLDLALAKASDVLDKSYTPQAENALGRMNGIIHTDQYPRKALINGQFSRWVVQEGYVNELICAESDLIGSLRECDALVTPLHQAACQVKREIANTRLRGEALAVERAGRLSFHLLGALTVCLPVVFTILNARSRILQGAETDQVIRESLPEILSSFMDFKTFLLFEGVRSMNRNPIEDSINSMV